MCFGGSSGPVGPSDAEKAAVARQEAEAAAAKATSNAEITAAKKKAVDSAIGLSSGTARSTYEIKDTSAAPTGSASRKTLIAPVTNAGLKSYTGI